MEKSLVGQEASDLQVAVLLWTLTTILTELVAENPSRINILYLSGVGYKRYEDKKTWTEGAQEQQQESVSGKEKQAWPYPVSYV